jgi:cysteine-rich repeat protein
VRVFHVRSGIVKTVGAVAPDDPLAPAPGPDPLDPADGGGDGTGAGEGGGAVFVTAGRCLEERTTPCTSSGAQCQTGEFCGAGNTCKRDHGTCRTAADCPAGVVTTCTTSETYTAAAADSDGDLIPDPLDNCPRNANADQADADGDDVGNPCDLETCGNSLIEVTEECDDGNTSAGDGCSPLCRSESGPCDDGLDNDGDTLVDFGSDPGCASVSAIENPKCDDDLDNDSDGTTDWNGPGTPDPQCLGKPWQDRERKLGCGLGAELALALAALCALGRGRSRLAWRRGPVDTTMRSVGD